MIEPLFFLTQEPKGPITALYRLYAVSVEFSSHSFFQPMTLGYCNHRLDEHLVTCIITVACHAKIVPGENCTAGYNFCNQNCTGRYNFCCEKCAGVTGMWVPPYFGSGGTHMPRQLGPPPGPKCLGIWVRVIICTCRHLGPGRGRRGGPSFLMRFIYWHRRF